MMLDVGCGNHPRGNVNVDRNRTEARCTFVQADCHFLPFRSNVFHEVCCNYVLPYFGSPEKALREMLRVAEEKVWLRVPHRFSGTARSQYGKVKPYHSFNIPWFKQLLKNYCFSFRVDYEPWMQRFPILRPGYIEVEIWKKN